MANKTPFLKAFKRLTTIYGMQPKEALEEIQKNYDKFKSRNQKLTERQNDQSNSAQIQLISHFATLAALTLTVAGFLITQSSHSLNSNHKIIFLCLLVSEIVSISFGAIDYIQTILFHNGWAKMYKEIDDEVNEKFNSGALDELNDLRDIEEKHLSMQKSSTKTWVTYCMLVFCIVGLLLLALLFYSFFFDVPIYD